MHSISQEVEGKRRKGKPKRKSIDPRKENKQEKNITSELKIVPEKNKCRRKRRRHERRREEKERKKEDDGKEEMGIYCSDSLPAAPLRAGRRGSSVRTTSRSDGEPITRSRLLGLVL